MNLIFLSAFREILEWVSGWASSMVITMGYPGLAVVMFLENVFPPIPSEIILPFAGSLSSTGRFSLLGITLVGMLGSVAGAWVFYGIGYWLDENRVRFLIRRFGRYMLLSTNDFDRAVGWFQRHGDMVIFFGRMVPMVRSLISIPAGLAKMSPIRFTLLTAMGTACWSFGLAFIGKLLGENWVLIDQFLSTYELIVAIMFVLIFIVFFVRRIRKLSEQKSIA
jgi:membrane protein DedA with SNARE-associated domain